MPSIMKFEYFVLLFLLLSASASALAPRETALQKSESAPSRRAFVSKAIPSLFFVGCMDVQPAMAVKERNEALCNTGFFENIGQWYCTELGDISDEAKAKRMSEQEIGSMGGLLGKLGVEGDIVQDVEKGQEEKTTDKKKSKE